MKNVAIIIHKLKGGGAERVAANMSIELSKKYNVYLFVFDGSDIAYEYDGTVVDYRTPPTSNKLMKLPLMVKRVILTRKYKKKYAIDCSISHLPHNNIINVLSKCGDKIIVVNHHMMSSTEKVNRAAKTREKFLARSSDCSVIVSKQAREDLIEQYGVDPQKARTIYNAVDYVNIEKLKNVPVKEIGVDKNTIISAGRMSDQKGQWHLIRAFSLVKKKHPEWKLVLLGDGPLRNEFTVLITKLGIQDSVLMPGFVSNPFPYISTAGFYAFSSNHEGLPMALLEAAACGKAIVSTDCDSGCREILAPSTKTSYKTCDVERAEYGVLVPVCKGFDYYTSEKLTEEEMKMAEALCSLIEDVGMRQYYEEQSKKICERFATDAIYDMWSKLID